MYHPATGQRPNASAGLPACTSNMECRAFSTTPLGTGNALLAGGLAGLISNPQTTATAMLYQPDTNIRTSTGSMTTPREGQTAGTVFSGGTTVGFLCSNGTITNLGSFLPAAINDNGVMAGGPSIDSGGTVQTSTP